MDNIEYRKRYIQRIVERADVSEETAADCFDESDLSELLATFPDDPEEAAEEEMSYLAMMKNGPKRKTTMNEDIARLADGYVRVEDILRRVFDEHPDKFKQLVIDLDDMRMSGKQIDEAFSFSGDSLETFIINASIRNADMIAFVNGNFLERTARQHGEQRTIPKIDGAVKDILEKAEADGTLQRLDEGAEAVNNFFLSLLVAMQAGKKFTTNVRINLNTGNGEWGVFAVSLVELLNRDGTPFKAQPQDEEKRILELAEPKPDESGIYDALEKENE